MKAGTKRRWLAALRSGEYTHTVGWYCTTRGYCALGVLLDITCDAEWVMDPSPYMNHRRFDLCRRRKKADKMYPTKVLHSLGLSDEVIRRLVGLNDYSSHFWILGYEGVIDYIERCL